MKADNTPVSSDTVFPSMPKSFQSPDKAIEAMFALVGMLGKSSNKSNERAVKLIGLGMLKSERAFWNKNTETSVVRFSSNDCEHRALMKLGNCAEPPTQAWHMHSKREEANVGSPTTLGRNRKAFKLITKAMKTI